MNGSPFKLGTFATSGGGAFAAIVLGDDAIPLAAAAIARKSALASATTASKACWMTGTRILRRCRSSWPFSKRKAGPARKNSPSLRALPPVARPGKMFYAAQNFQEHVDEMLRAGMTPAAGPEIHRREIDVRSLSVSQGAEHAVRRHRRHRHSARPEEDRLGGGDRARHRQAGQAHQGRARARARRRLHDHQRRLGPRPANPRRPAGAALRLAQRQEPRQFRADGAVSGAARFRAGRR